MTDIRTRILEETQIGKLKLLIIELNRTLSDNEKISGYSTYTLSKIEDLRKIALKKIDNKSVNMIEDNLSIMTVAQLKALALNKGLYVPSRALKNDIIRLIESKNIPSPSVPRVPTPFRVSSPDTTPSSTVPSSTTSDISGMTVAQLKAFAVQKGIYIPSKASKSQIISIIESNLSKGTSSQKGTSSPEDIPVCLTDKSQDSLNTTPLYDYNNFKFNEFQANSMDSCLSHVSTKNIKAGSKGSYGVTFSDMYKGTQAIFKVVKFPNPMGVEGFKWECVITKRAALLGVGPQVLEMSICYHGKTPKFGVLILGKCGPISFEYTFNKSEVKQIYQSIVKLHNNGISHRDLGLRNIMRSGDKLVLIDYGLALAFPGPVPDGYKIWDHSYLAYDSQSYYEYLTTIFSAKDINRIDNKLGDDVVIESMTVQYMPVEMIKTLGRDKAVMYFNNASTTSKAIIIERKFDKRLKDEGIRA